MFQVAPEHIRRVSFASRLFPKVRSAIGIDAKKTESSSHFDGEIFCRGRSKNRDILTFYGFVSEPNGASTFTQLPLLRRSIKKLTNLVENELEYLGAQEVRMPTLIPQKLWRMSKRFERNDNELETLYKFVDKTGNELLLGPTYEEVITKVVSDIDCFYENELPIMLYQTSPKFRCEPNPRFGLLRTNEFIMNDLYSFDANLDRAIVTYKNISQAYKNIFSKLNLNCIKIEGATGSIGGRYSHEYQLPVSSGEDTIVKCDKCSHTANLELQSERKHDCCPKCGSNNVDHIKSIELGHTFLLSDLYSKVFNARYTKSDGNGREIFEMGCFGLGITRILGAGIDIFSMAPINNDNDSKLQLRWPSNVEPYKFAIVTPAKRSKQYNSGSTEYCFNLVKRLLDATRNTDILVEDKDKDGIGRRLLKLQELGIPNIIILGKKFLQDEPELELLELDDEKKSYKQSWMTQNQLCDYVTKIDQL